MNFAEFRFWELFLSALAVLLLLRLGLGRVRPQALVLFDKLALLGLGLFLLLCVSAVTFVIFLVISVGSYAGLAWVLRHQEQQRRRYLLVLIPLQLLPLFWYKYADFAANHVLGLQLEPLRDLIIPVGISFYTFQKIAFVIDTLHFQKPLPRFLDYMNFVGFFPQIVAGPIERRENLLPQMEQFRFRWLKDDIDTGASWIALGLFFKCALANNLAAYFDPGPTTNAYLIWLANVLFGLRIYYDFAGYSLVALGLARCLGIRLTLNFASPYCATSSTEFWRRWHITLSQWFRDYLYVPLGGGRTRAWAFNIALVFVVSGVWHGAGWNFVLWGALHGTFLIVNRLFGPRLKLPAPVAWLLTISASFVAWLAFYELRTAVLADKLVSLVRPAAYNREALREAVTHWESSDALVMCSLLALTITMLMLEWSSVRKGGEPYHLLLRPRALMVLAVLTVVLAPGKNNGFIYFAF